MQDTSLSFDVYGRYILQVCRQDGGWRVFKQIGERLVELHDFTIPPFMDADGIAVFLDDMLHEASRPGEAIRRLD